MGRVLGVDVGSKRTGFAVSDQLGITCRPLKVVRVNTVDDTVSAIISTVEEQQAETIVVGIPRPLRGGHSDQTDHTLAVVRSLCERSHVPVVSWDERFTTKMAREVTSSEKKLDAVAAAFILQNYLDAQK